MKSILPFLSIALIVTSCTTAYNSGQTPDDVYFSPERPQNEYVRMESKQNKYRYEESEDDRYLRMKVRNRRLWSDLTYYYNDPLAYNYYYNRYNNFYIGGSPWNFYNSWNYYHNPYSYYNPYGNGKFYGTPVYVVNPQTRNYNRPRQYNMNVYNSPAPSGNSPRVSNNNGKRVFSNNGSAGRPSYGTPSSNTGSNMRSVFGNSNSSSSSSTPARTQTSSSSSSSSSSSNSSSSGKSGNAGVRKF